MHKFLFFKLVYYIPLHVSSTVVLIIRKSNCIIQHLVSSHSVGCRPVRSCAPDGIRRSKWPPDDEHNSARNM